MPTSLLKQSRKSVVSGVEAGQSEENTNQDGTPLESNTPRTPKIKASARG